LRKVDRRQALRILGAAVAVGALPGCSPEFDWRELHSVEGRFRILMPGRWKVASGPAPSGATLTLWTVDAGHALFGAGYADFAAGARAGLQPMIDGLGRNVQGRVTEDREDRIPGIAGRAVRIDGVASDGIARQVHGRFYARERRLYQLAVISPRDAVPALQLETFFGSFTVY
jgi:hypothetical protein